MIGCTLLKRQTFKSSLPFQKIPPSPSDTDPARGAVDGGDGGHHRRRHPIASHGPPRPTPAYPGPAHTLGLSWLGWARMGRPWWPMVAVGCRRCSCRWWCRWWPRPPPPTTTTRPPPTTTRPSPCVPRLTRDALYSPLIPHARGMSRNSCRSSHPQAARAT